MSPSNYDPDKLDDLLGRLSRARHKETYAGTCLDMRHWSRFEAEALRDDLSRITRIPHELTFHMKGYYFLRTPFQEDVRPRGTGGRGLPYRSVALGPTAHYHWLIYRPHARYIIDRFHHSTGGGSRQG